MGLEEGAHACRLFLCAQMKSINTAKNSGEMEKDDLATR